MKRFATTMLCATVSVLCCLAQQLPGTWVMEQNHSGMTFSTRFEFGNNGTLHTEVIANIDRPEIGQIVARGNVDGLWQQPQDSVLTVQLDMQSLNIEFDRMDLSPAIAELVGQGSVYGTRLNQMAREAVTRGLQREFGDGSQEIHLRITRLNESELQLRNDRTRHTLDFRRE